MMWCLFLLLAVECSLRGSTDTQAILSTDQVQDNTALYFLDSITNNYTNTNIELQKDFNCTKENLLSHYPIQKFPNYEDDGIAFYIPAYSLPKYVCLKAKYVNEFKHYKKNIDDFATEGKAKMQKYLKDAQDALKNFEIYSNNTSPILLEHRLACQELLKKLYASYVEWFDDDIDDLLTNYHEKFT
ncbi:hypothetical protein DSO57_1021771 [Entomophthora muscae]|uniref:Uncharacterized protein n=1 Tax=Entomophthora muscae TaxID=34485 RepID=A0ACC2TQY5_9FUNG|nr:hypothetical protein DSO57_1021771 [Entomophthora muscae]